MKPPDAILIAISDPELSSIRVTCDLGTVISTQEFDVTNVPVAVVAVCMHINRKAILRGEPKP